MSVERTGAPDWRYWFRLALGLLFLWASLAKIADLSAFASQVHNFRLLPLPLENLFAMTLPWIELVAGVLLVINVAPRAGTAVLGVLLLVFLVAIVAAMARGLDIDCGCFGTSDAAKTGWLTLGRDLLFLALAVLGYPRRTGVVRATREAHAV